jgi:ribosomal protein S18 acetylase RimI-like enzyme
MRQATTLPAQAVTIIPAHEISFDQQAEVFREAFAGYVGGSFAMDATTLASFLRSQGIDLCYSRIARDTRGLCGFGYISRIGDVSRLSGMGVIPSARRMGVARNLLLCLIEEARRRQDRAMVLEVIEQNPAAVALYRSEGFREIATLLGWRRKPGPLASISSATRPHIIPTLVAGHSASALEFPELPWQISRHAIVRLANPRAYSSKGAAVVLDDPGHGKPIRVCALISTVADTPDWATVRNLLGSVVQHFHLDREVFAPPIFPEIFGAEIFVPLGFVQDPLRQYLFRREL